MKGIIFNIAEDFLTEKYGEELLEEIMEASHLATQDPFIAPATYPDSDFWKIIGQCTLKLEMETHDFLRELGHYTFLKLASRYPAFVTPYDDPKEFLKTIENVVHVEVRKLYTDTYLPTFIYHEPAENELIITYYSKRKLYPYMEGLIEGVADWFDTTIHQHHRIYQKNQNEYCDFSLRFEHNASNES